jgi:lipoyl(octanoyl) transferase
MDSRSTSDCFGVRDLGVIPYAEACALQEQLVVERKSGAIPDTLLIVEHPHVFTLGRNATEQNILRVPEGCEVHHTNRGGDVTYHGPGQLVGYPIVDLAGLSRRDIAWYMRTLEQSLIEALATFGIAGERIPCLTGVWVDNNKIAAMGVHLSRWVTSHGFALNVNTDLAWFDCIVPCGIRDRGVTSMKRELGRAVVFDDVKRAVIKSLQENFSPIRSSSTHSLKKSAQPLDSLACFSHSVDKAV